MGYLDECSTSPPASLSTMAGPQRLGPHRDRHGWFCSKVMLFGPVYEDMLQRG